MAETLSPLVYGKVVGRFLAAVGDSTDDADVYPDAVPLSGTVTFTPSAAALLVPVASPDPATVLPVPVVTTLDAGGYISINSQRGVYLLATNDPSVNPQGYTYDVSFSGLSVNGQSVKYADIQIQVLANQTTDLTLVTPVAASGGVLITQGAPGTPGRDGAQGLKGDNTIELSVLSQFTPSFYPGLDTTGATDTASRLTSAVANTPTGGHLVIPPGDYLLNSTIQINKSIKITCLPGARFIVNHTNIGFNIAGAFETQYTVSTVAQITSAANGDGTTSNATQFTLSGNATYTAGDLVRVVADGDENDVNGVGQFMTVISVSGTVVTCAGFLRSTFAGNIRMARLPPQPVEVHGMKVDHSDAVLAGGVTPSTIVNFEYLIDPKVDLFSSLNAGAAPLTFHSCYAYSAENIRVRYAQNITSSRFGWAIGDAGSEFGSVLNLQARRVRNGFYAAAAGSTAAGGSFGTKGRCVGARVAMSLVHGASSSAYETSASAEDVTFNQCEAVDSYTAFTLRGRRHHVLSSRAIGGKYGITIAQDATSLPTYGHRIEGVRLKDQTLQAFALNLIASETRATYLTDVDISGTGAEAITVKFGMLVADGLRLRPPAIATAAYRSVYLTNGGALTGKNWEYDARTNTAGTGMFIFQADSNTCSIAIDGFDVANTADHASRLAYIVGAGASMLLRLENAVFDYLPTNLVDPAITTPPLLAWRNRTTGAPSYVVTRSTAAAVSGADVAQAIAQQSATLVYFISTSTTAATLPPLLAGRFVGQRLRVTARGAQVTIQNGSAYKASLPQGVNYTVPSGRTVELTWDGTNWYLEYPLYLMLTTGSTPPADLPAGTLVVFS